MLKHQKLSLAELNRLNIEQYKKQTKLPIVVVLDNIRSMSNIGSIFRTSDAFMIDSIHLCGITSQPPQNEIRKTALGATESVKWQYFEKTMDSIDNLKKLGYQIISIEQAQNSLKLQDFQPVPHKKLALIVGNEVKGVNQKIIDVSDICLEIPQFGTKHSLNVSISAGLVIWHVFQNVYLNK